jgi:hypothetical protein
LVIILANKKFRGRYKAFACYLESPKELIPKKDEGASLCHIDISVATVKN